MLFALCIEASHQRGMGHLFRMLRFASFIREKGEDVIFLLNKHAPSLTILRENSLDYHIVDIGDIESNWERNLIHHYGIDLWINDRLNTCSRHALHVNSCSVKLVTLDDRGSGAVAADLNIAALVFDNVQELRGGKVLSGARYLILNPEIIRSQRQRTHINKILISMGGSDTYGVTLQIVRMLKSSPLLVTVIVGPGFEGVDQLRHIMPVHFDFQVNVPSLIGMFPDFDLAITGGGVTPFEACASGLPCIVVATEDFEVPVGKYLERTGGCMFAGYYKTMKSITINQSIDIEKLSRQAMASVDTKGADRVYEEIMAL